MTEQPAGRICTTTTCKLCADSKVSPLGWVSGLQRERTGRSSFAGVANILLDQPGCVCCWYRGCWTAARKQLQQQWDCFCVRGALIPLGKTKQTVSSPVHLLGRSVQSLVLVLAISLFISHIFQTNRDDKSVQFIATHNAGNFAGSEASWAICCWP